MTSSGFNDGLGPKSATTVPTTPTVPTVLTVTYLTLRAVRSASGAITGAKVVKMTQKPPTLLVDEIALKVQASVPVTNWSKTSTKVAPILNGEVL